MKASPRARASFAALLALATSLVACGGSTPPAPPPGTPIPPAPDLAERMAALRPPSPAATKCPEPFARMRDRILDQWLAAEPSIGRSLGLHQYDGKIADYSAEGIAKRVDQLKSFRRDLGTVDKGALSPDESLDLAILENQIDLTLFRLVDLAEWQVRPQFYQELFSIDSYVLRDYAPIGERAKHLVQHLEAALASVPDIRKNLKSPLSRPVAETAVKIYAGFAEYLRGDVTKIMKGAGDADTISRFAKASAALASEAEAFADHLKTVEVPKGDRSHVLGIVRYKKLLAVQEGLSIDLSSFKHMGELDLAKNHDAYLEAKKKAAVTRPKATALLGDAASLMESARKFVVSKRIASIPEGATLVVKESPPYQRWNAAFLDPPGPFEAARNAFYYITLPDASWPAKEQEEYIPARGILLSTTVHETYPGHFLQGQWVLRAPTRVQKIFGSYSFVEGWAHYGEEVMIEEGFGKEDPQNRLGQLSDALLRDCRYLVSLGVHTEGMTLEAAEKRFMVDCFQDKATAREQAVRATFDPGYFAYTLGKIQLLALRDEAKKRLGKKFDLMRFHDEVLAHGSPPVPLIRDRVLLDLEQAAR